MTTLRRLAGSSPAPPSHLLSRLFSTAASSFLTEQYSAKKGGDGGVGLRDGGNSSAPRPGLVEPSSWRWFDSRAVGIPQNAIPHHAWTVLKTLRLEGFDSYLVGGCVRDLLLKRVPKDFDVITTASPEQIKKMMKHCIIIGRRFPICQIKMLESTIEVSSFGTNDTYMKKSEEVDCLEGANGYNDGGILRWNSMKRDFTINSLFFNPMNYRIYDYVNGVSDMRKKKVRTVVPAHVSFKEDPARILRGLRIAGRLGFQFSSETSKAIRDLSSSIMTIPKGRLMVEMNYMLSYGAAESTFRLLRKYGLLDILLPFQAAYLSDQMKGRSSDRDLMLMKLFANLDKLLSADRPCHRSLWLALLAFHSALINSPQDAQVVKAFAALLHLGSWERTINFLEQDVGARAPFVPETLRPSGTKLDNLMEQTSHLASLVESSVQTLTCLDALQQSVARHWEPSQFSGVVFVSKTEGGRLLRIFEGLSSDLTSYDHGRGMHGIDYRLLKDWNPSEIRFVLGKVILDTMNDRLPCASTEDAGITRTTPVNLADGIRPRLSTSFQS